MWPVPQQRRNRWKRRILVLRKTARFNLGFSPRSSTKVEAILTLTGTELGTAGYMSPEQLRGEKLDARTDIFSFGLVLYEMATGQRAFIGETAAIVRDAILNNPPAPVRELNSTIPAELAATIDKCLEKEPSIPTVRTVASLPGAP